MGAIRVIQFNEDWQVWVSTDGHIYRQASDKQFVEYSRSVTNSGYYQVGLCIGGKARPRLVHRLVAETFLENPKNLRDVDHIDSDRLNNNVENLRFSSHSFNCGRGIRKIGTDVRARITAALVKAHAGKVWFTDGTRNAMANPDECPAGFHRGFTKSRHGFGHTRKPINATE